MKKFSFALVTIFALVFLISIASNIYLYIEMNKFEKWKKKEIKFENSISHFWEYSKLELDENLMFQIVEDPFSIQDIENTKTVLRQWNVDFFEYDDKLFLSKKGIPDLQRMYSLFETSQFIHEKK